MALKSDILRTKNKQKLKQKLAFEESEFSECWICENYGVIELECYETFDLNRLLISRNKTEFLPNLKSENLRLTEITLTDDLYFLFGDIIRDFH